MPDPPDSSDDIPENTRGRRRRLTHSRLHRNLGNIPGITSIRFEETGSGISEQVRGMIDAMFVADGLVSADEAYVQVNWWPQPNGEEDWFQIHYTERSGIDCGWHRHANDHVDDRDHFQEPESSETEYRYRAVSFESENPVGILWEVVDERLQDLLKQRYQ